VGGRVCVARSARIRRTCRTCSTWAVRRWGFLRDFVLVAQRWALLGAIIWGWALSSLYGRKKRVGRCRRTHGACAQFRRAGALCATYTLKRARTSLTGGRARAFVNGRARIRTCVRARIRTCVCARMRACVRACVRVYVRAGAGAGVRARVARARRFFYLARACVCACAHGRVCARARVGAHA